MKKAKFFCVWPWTAYAKGRKVGFVGNNFLKNSIMLTQLTLALCALIDILTISKNNIVTRLFTQ